MKILRHKLHGYELFTHGSTYAEFLPYAYGLADKLSP